MPKIKPASIQVEDIAPPNLENFRKNQFENAKTKIQIFLMWMLASMLVVFVILLIVSGVASNILPDVEGVHALTKLFIDITANAKAVALVTFGFFFRDYLNAKNA